MLFGLRSMAALCLLAGLIFVASAPPELTAQSPQKDKKQKYEDVSFLTVDGLRLFGAWYSGGKGRQSDVVMMLPNYKSEFSKGDWGTLAEKLQEEGFSVLVFDFRGHGKSKSIKTIEDGKTYVNTYNFPWNKLAGISTMTNPTTLKGVDASKFRDAIFPYLVNDIWAARKFIDLRNDGGECNAGRISIIADRDSCSLGMAWMGTEFKRLAVYAKNTFDIAPANHYGSKDLMGAVWLSFHYGPGGVRTLINTAIQSDRVAYEIIKDKVSMAFVSGDGDKESQAIGREWFSKWGIAANAEDEPKLGKYLVKVKDAKSLTGINLCDPTKNLNTISQIVDFMKQTQKKNLAGGDWVIRNANSDPPPKIGFDMYGLKNP